jgi:uncharacterized iron-regulated membrane protein
MRAVWVRVHLWLGLTLGRHRRAAGHLGCILVYDHEIDAWLHPARYAVSGSGFAFKLADYARIARRKSATSHGRAWCVCRTAKSVPWSCSCAPRAASSASTSIPPTATCSIRAGNRDLVPWMHNFHESLTLRDYWGRELVGCVGIAMLISSLSGLYLWWPVGRFRREALGFRRGFALHRNLHYTVGFWGALVLAMLSFTGIFLGFPEAGRSVVAAFGKVSPSPRGVQSASAEGRSIAADEAADIARAATPERRSRRSASRRARAASIA